MAKKPSNFDGKPSTHPERKGQLNKSPLKNWVEKAGGLPTYINSVATALKREHPGWPTSRVIATAVNWAKKVCSTGKAMGGNVTVSKAVQSAACNAVASWEKKKASARVSMTESRDKLSDEDLFALFQEVYEVESFDETILESTHSGYGDLERAGEDSGRVQDAAVLEGDASESGGVVEDAGNPGTADLTVYQLPVDFSSPTQLGKRRWRKSVMPIGAKIMYKGSEVDFTREFAEQVVRNFTEKPFERVPLVLADPKTNEHVENPELERGEVISLELGETTVDAIVETDERGSEIFTNSPKMGVSPRILTGHVRGFDGREFGPSVRHLAVTQFPYVHGLGDWAPVDLSEKAEINDLSAETYVEEPTSDTKGGVVVEAEKNEKVDLTDEQKAEIQRAIDLAESYKGQVDALRSEMARKETEARIEKLADEGVPNSLLDLARPLLARSGDGDVIDLSDAEGNETKSTVSEQVFALLSEMKAVPQGEVGTTDLTEVSGDDDIEDARKRLSEMFGD